MPKATERERIYQLRAAGQSLREITAVLNGEGVPTAHGGREWHARTVRNVLSSTG